MTKRTIADKCSPFKEAINFLGSLDYVNCGGCAIAAVYLYDLLIKEGYKPELVYCYYDYSLSFDLNEKFINGEGKKLRGCSHAVVMVNGEYYDSNGLDNSIKNQYDKFHIMSRDIVLHSIKKPSNWNNTFHRPTNMKRIKQYFGYSILSRTKKNLVGY